MKSAITKIFTIILCLNIAVPLNGSYLAFLKNPFTAFYTALAYFKNQRKVSTSPSQKQEIGLASIISPDAPKINQTFKVEPSQSSQINDKVLPKKLKLSNHSLSSGLVNQGSTCYLNSLIQILKNIKSLNRYLTNNQEILKDPIVLNYREVLHKISNSKNNWPVDPKNFCNAMIEQMKIPSFHVQGDIDEALGCVLNALTPQENLKTPFKFHERDYRICSSCHTPTQGNIEELTQFIVPIEGHKKIDDCLDNYYGQSQKLFNCDHCHKENIEHDVKRNMLNKPEIAFVTLKRFKDRSSGKNNDKNNDKIEIPSTLNLNKYLKRNLEKIPAYARFDIYPRGKMAKENNWAQVENIFQTFNAYREKYTLKGIAFHDGNSPHSGHYTTAVINEDKDRLSGFLYNDKRVTNLSEADIKNILKSGKNNGALNTAYLLTYERQK